MTNNNADVDCEMSSFARFGSRIHKFVRGRGEWRAGLNNNNKEYYVEEIYVLNRVVMVGTVDGP